MGGLFQLFGERGGDCQELGHRTSGLPAQQILNPLFLVHPPRIVPPLCTLEKWPLKGHLFALEDMCGKGSLWCGMDTGREEGSHATALELGPLSAPPHTCSER